MREVVQNLHSIRNDLVTNDAVYVRNNTYSAGIVFQFRKIQPLIFNERKCRASHARVLFPGYGLGPVLQNHIRPKLVLHWVTWLPTDLIV